jgi:RND family efflux transporter MFP subunit
MNLDTPGHDSVDSTPGPPASGAGPGCRNRKAWGAWLAASAWLVTEAAGCGGGNTYVEPPPPEVLVTSPVRRGVTSYLEYTGTTQAFERVDLRARVRGFLKQRLFREGDEVKAGQLLLVIDEEPFLAQLQQAKGREAEAEAMLRKAEESKARQVSEAQLAVDQAQLALSRLDGARNRALLSRNAGSREEVEKSEATLRKSEAQVEADQASLEQARADYEINILAAGSSLQAAQATRRLAEIDLSYCRIHAPIDGRITKTEFDVGNYVGEGQSSVLATIVRVDPIYAYVSVSEDDLLRVQKMMIRQGKRPDAHEEAVPIEMGLGDEDGYPHEGRVNYADPSVDVGTGTLRVRGIFPNPDRTITPGLFVRVRLPFERREDALLVPDRALGSDQGGPYLLVVGKDDKVERRAVRPGVEVDGMRVVDGKIAPGDRVVVEGLQRARPGLKVTPKAQESAPTAVAVAVPADGDPSLPTP